ncbi:transcriptional regulator with XRE-family HTH domain [Streptomyces umbrinus]|uniref:Transcriptional regulator with XRE-family HTH domain n=1 Tax=Streptomyces umbrinus TaxID=67370 RepID=A0ABU0SGI8_9ACTN|nr:helix-turn-helix transcriptional regulator [Streptomyces umbrinus]MDQ1022671.1 transcriptional regulator with XRE-family HTH domain [Streptomyces umbrinus]
MSMSLDERVRSAIAALLHAAGESQAGLAAALGVSQAQVSRRQSGAAVWSLADCEAVAAHYGITAHDLLAGPTRAAEALPAERRRVPGRNVPSARSAAVDGGV